MADSEFAMVCVDPAVLGRSLGFGVLSTTIPVTLSTLPSW